MPGYIVNIEDETKKNADFRRVIFTAPHSQLVLMSLKPWEEIGEEVHENVDQFFRIDAGQGKVVIDGVETDVMNGYAIVIPAGTKHNVINTSDSDDLKLYTIYSPANHPEGTIHATKEDAMKAEVAAQ
jgi:mannose-6-phosphate isomerase-like protein (cupin superfamily)